eukprot:2753526-Amphidinium_carterae.1
MRRLLGNHPAPCKPKCALESRANEVRSPREQPVNTLNYLHRYCTHCKKTSKGLPTLPHSLITVVVALATVPPRTASSNGGSALARLISLSLWVWLVWVFDFEPEGFCNCFADTLHYNLHLSGALSSNAEKCFPDPSSPRGILQTTAKLILKKPVQGLQPCTFFKLLFQS